MKNILEEELIKSAKINIYSIESEKFSLLIIENFRTLVFFYLLAEILKTKTKKRIFVICAEPKNA